MSLLCSDGTYRGLSAKKSKPRRGDIAMINVFLAIIVVGSVVTIMEAAAIGVLLLMDYK